LVDFVWQGKEDEVKLAMGNGKVRFYRFSQREKLGKEIGFTKIEHYWLLGGVGLTIFEKAAGDN
jgi:hypothetical protein